MAKGANLKGALDRVKGRNVKLEQQRKHEKVAAKKRALKAQQQVEENELASEEEIEEAANDLELVDGEDGGVSLLDSAAEEAAHEDGFEGDESSEGEENEIDLSRLAESDSDTDEELFDGDASADEHDDDVDEADEDEIPLSDIDSLDSEERGDIVPRQRLTINNTSALTSALKRISLPYSKIPFSEHQAITSKEPVEIKDIDDDLSRELAFYAQSIAAVKEARQRLKKEGVPFTRPNDYFAEMVKSDEHMGKIKQKLVKDASEKKAAQDARKQRDLKKFGKQVQVAKLQERAKEKRATLDRISDLKRKRKGADIENANEEDMFDVALENAEETAKAERASRKAAAPGRTPNAKRQKKDEKYGFGGKKRYKNANDALSSADTNGFSVKKMKGKAPRPGKSKRAKMR